MPAGVILLIEDNPELQTLYREQLERFGPYTVLVAGDGVEGLEMLEAKSPDLLLLNLNLPHVGGREVAHRAREHDADLPIIIVSGHDLRHSFDDALLADYLVKPISPETLVNAVRNQLPVQPRGTDAELEQQ